MRSTSRLRRVDISDLLSGYSGTIPDCCPLRLLWLNWIEGEPPFCGLFVQWLRNKLESLSDEEQDQIERQDLLKVGLLVRHVLHDGAKKPLEASEALLIFGAHVPS